MRTQAVWQNFCCCCCCVLFYCSSSWKQNNVENVFVVVVVLSAHKKMAIFGRKLVGKEVLKREPIGYENFSSKVHKLFGHELEKTAAASTITSSYSTATHQQL